MKASLDKNGMITIESENELEDYALRQWSKENTNADCKNITIKMDSGLVKLPSQSDKR